MWNTIYVELARECKAIPSEVRLPLSGLRQHLLETVIVSLVLEHGIIGEIETAFERVPKTIGNSLVASIPDDLINNTIEILK